MGIIDRLTTWMTLPAVENTTYRCADCADVVDAAEPTCPACGGEVEMLLHQPADLYWPHY